MASDWCLPHYQPRPTHSQSLPVQLPWIVRSFFKDISLLWVREKSSLPCCLISSWEYCNQLHFEPEWKNKEKPLSGLLHYFCSEWKLSSFITLQVRKILLILLSYVSMWWMHLFLPVCTQRREQKSVLRKNPESRGLGRLCRELLRLNLPRLFFQQHLLKIKLVLSFMMVQFYILLYNMKQI